MPQKNSETLRRFTSQVAIAMVATSGLTTATRAFVRRLELDSEDQQNDSLTDFFNIFVDICFYVYLGITFIVQEGIHRYRSKAKRGKGNGGLKCCAKVFGPIFYTASIPFVIVEKILTKIEKAFITYVDEAKEEERAKEEGEHYGDADL